MGFRRWFGGFVMLCVLGADGGRLEATEQTEPPAGLRHYTPSIHVLTGARIVTAPGKVIESGTIVLRDGVILEVGAEVSPRADAQVHDCTGKTIYPGLIEAYSELATPSSRTDPVVRDGYWNPEIRPQVRAIDRYAPAADLNQKLRSQGVAVRLVAPSGGIVHGTSAVVTTGDDDVRRSVLRDEAALHLQLTTTRGRDSYPRSPMGAFTLVRQAFLDAQWYRLAWDTFARGNVPRPETSTALEVLARYRDPKQLVVIHAPDILYFFRADQVAREFSLPAAVLGSGEEYQRIEEVAATGRTVIVPLNFPKAPNVSTAEAALSVPLSRLMHWDLAPENPARLHAAGVKIALTGHGLDDRGKLLEAVRKATARGLDPDAALAALTTVPAQLLGIAHKAGTLEAGKAAHLLVADGDLFAAKTKVLETWVDGRRYEVQRQPRADLRGSWTLRLTHADGGSESVTVLLEGEPGKLSGKLTRAGKQAKFDRTALDGLQWQATLKGEAVDWSGVVRFSGTLVDDNRWQGTVAWADGSATPFVAARVAEPQPEAAAPAEEPANEKAAADKPAEEPAAAEEQRAAAALFAVNFPLGEFGWEQPPETPAVVVFRNATVWTCGEDGILENASVLVEKGIIKAVGRRIKAPADALVIDCQGKHLTPGIIDCHSHIATDGGVNESGQTITAEVRIGDFIDPLDINIYRQLAGGVTAANILHGSANTIGGQNQVVKFRWGRTAEAMKFAEAPPGIKFALGENVKQSNWGENFRTRYPQTRMGVEQLLRDAFNAAVLYRVKWQDFRQFKRGLPPRVDLELEALSEVVTGKRLIHCHSYRQDEILATMRVCEEFNVRIGTFQHILEGYKVADVMARHGVGGSSFSDWWAYKFEVYDAIPYNGALLYEAGVVTSFNSDDAELARRLNLEAAKAVKYGGVPPEEALKFVTFNPARQLGVDHLVGSIEPGKQADLVVWNGSPLSSLARCEQTWVDGCRYFDRDTDRQLREQAARQRAALVQRVLASGEPTESIDRPRTASELWPREDIYCGHSHGRCECHSVSR